MPIIIVTADYCYDGRKHAKISLNGAEKIEDDDEPIVLKPKERLKGIDIRRESYSVTEDMKDVYALKVIHISETSTTNPEHAETTVIGENIYFERDEKAMKELNDALSGNTKRGVEEVQVTEPSLIQKIRRYRSTNEKIVKTKTLMAQIKESNRRIQSVKAGSKLVTDGYNLDECIKWAILYVTKHAASLSTEVLEILEDLETFEQNKINAVKDESLPSKKPAARIKKVDKNTKVVEAVTAASIAERLDKCSVDGLEAFMQAQICQNRKTSRSRQTDIEVITARKPTHPVLEAVHEDTEAGNDQHEHGPIGVRPAPPNSCKPSSGNEGRRASMLHSRPKVGFVDHQTRSGASVPETTEAASGGVPGVVDADEEGALMAPKVTQKTSFEISAPKAPKSKPKSLREIRSLRAVQARTAALKAREAEFKRILDVANRDLQTSVTKVTTLQSVVDKKLGRLNEHATDVFNIWTAFDHKIKEDQDVLCQLCVDKDFMFRRNMASKLHNAPMGSSRDPGLCSSVQKELSLMNKKAKEQQHAEYIERISSVAWFIGAVRKLQETMKKSATPIPTCCFQFLTVLKYLFLFGFKFDSEPLFYRIIEPIFRSEDYSKLVVHRLLKLAREAVGIGAEKFLRYLEAAQIQPCVALLTQVRMIQQRRALKAKVEMQKQAGGGSPSKSRLTLANSSSMSVSSSHRVSSVVLGEGSVCSTGSALSIDEDLHFAEQDDEDDEDFDG